MALKRQIIWVKRITYTAYIDTSNNVKCNMINASMCNGDESETNI